MKDSHVWILLLILALLVLLKLNVLRGEAQSKWYPGLPGEPPPWDGNIGDQVYWGGRWWAWTEAPGIGFRGWAPVGSE